MREVLRQVWRGACLLGADPNLAARPGDPRPLVTARSRHLWTTAYVTIHPRGAPALSVPSGCMVSNKPLTDGRVDDRRRPVAHRI